MPDFDANEDLTRLPVPRRRGKRGLRATLLAGRGTRRRACGPPMASSGTPDRRRRARCQRRAQPPGTPS
ncbi:MAG TPA: hypothetical protein VH061_12555 [Solirubrobacteraceae bacterium]|nr:hypothetical protein [Solirubrobacteraceae bacterium]